MERLTFFKLFIGLLFLLFFISCNNKLDINSENEKAHKIEYIKIYPPTEGIIGIAPDYPLPGDTVQWKGAFTAGRRVKLSPYAMAKFHVSYELWYSVKKWATDITEMGKNVYTFSHPNSGCEGSIGTPGAIPTENKKHPVTRVSWRDCIIWCNAYTEKIFGSKHCVYRFNGEIVRDATKFTGEDKIGNYDVDNVVCDFLKKGYRLPTEAEWEFAARYQGSDFTNARKYGSIYLTKLDSASGAKKPLGFPGVKYTEEVAGQKWNELKKEAERVSRYDAWYNGTEWIKLPEGEATTIPVGSKDPNFLGIYDMTGNVYEWCFDGYNGDPTKCDSQYLSKGFVINPLGDKTSVTKVIRGGSWYYPAQYTAVGKRRYFATDFRCLNRSFRLVFKPE